MNSELICGKCTACCLTETEGITLHPELGDDITKYETVEKDGVIRIAPRTDGKRGCRYVDKNCTIYEDRPIECRMFDCRIMYLNKTENMNREERRKMLSSHPLKDVLKAGKQRL